MVATAVAPSAIENLAATNSGLEPWWDSSPLIFQSWRDETLAGLSGEAREARAEHVDPQTGPHR